MQIKSVNNEIPVQNNCTGNFCVYKWILVCYTLGRRETEDGSMKDIRDVLGIKIESPLWDMAYGLAQKEKGNPEWLTRQYIINLHEK